MDQVFENLLILMAVVWGMAVLLRRFGLPTIMGELLMGVLLGPAVLGWIETNEVIETLAQMGIFFLMLHTGVETKPREFYAATKNSIGVAIVGAIVPFSVSLGVARVYGLGTSPAIFVGLTMTATAVVITLKILRDLGLHNTRMARIVIASCIIDDVLTLVIFSVALGMVNGGMHDPTQLLWIGAKSAFFFLVVIFVGSRIYPLFKYPFKDRKGKGFTFVLVLALSFGLFAEFIGLHIILGAYLAGLFFDEVVASPALIQKVEDRLYGIAYSFLGPIFFISLGFHMTFDALKGPGLLFVIALTVVCATGQILSAGGMARRLKFSWVESLVVGIGMCGRAEMAFILASLGLQLGAIDATTFSVLIITTFLLNIFTIVGLKWCALHLKRKRPAPPAPSVEEWP